MAGIIDLVGNTPLVEITRLNPNPKVKIYAKLEGNNPGGSIKDRSALNMIKSALERGEINKNSKLIEAASGNTGIALAMAAAARGYKLVLTMPETMSKERRILLRAYGAELILTPGPEGMGGAIACGMELEVHQIDAVGKIGRAHQTLPSSDCTTG